jgi:hypothetical protein
MNNGYIYAWSEKGQVVVTGTDGKKKIIGHGILPTLRPIDDAHALCVWEDDGQIYGSIFRL